MDKTEKEMRRQAEKYVEDRLGFLVHFLVFLGVNAFLFLVWYFTDRGFPWFLFVLGGWGIGLLVHFARTFMFRGLKEKWMADEMERLKKEEK